MTFNFSEISFANHWAFLLLAIVPLLLLWYYFFENKIHPHINYSNSLALELKQKSLKIKLRHLPFILRVVSIVFLILAIARPQTKKSLQDIKTEGIDIVVAFDVSPSMLAQDLKPNRIEAAKEVAQKFVDNRPNDRIGLVVFSGESYTQCPLTTDHAVLKNLFNTLKTGIIAEGTAIGLGLANAVNRLKDSKAKSKVIILMTDGVNNAGNISPIDAANIAKPYGIRVYTIGIGTRGMALSPVAVYPNGQYMYDYVECQIDEAVLTQISKKTNGVYNRATDKNSLAKIYAKIDKLEKTIVEEKQYTKKTELFMPLIIISFLLLSLEYILKNFWIKFIA
jgi:Ca-activated chloride channel homolog